jgi:aspartate racemase
MSWESSIEYERIINERVRDRLGGVASADLLIRSFNFADIETLQSQARWDDAARLLIEAATHLVGGGADAVVLCTNTMHKLADEIQDAIPFPLLHIADATAEAVHQAGLDTVALLGTRYTMEQDFYVGRLRSLHGLDVIVPREPDLTEVHDVIYGELVRGMINPDSRTRYLDIIDRLIASGAQGVIAGCTEIELLVDEDDRDVPVFPTARLHAEAAVAFPLS